ncbi:ABC transporter ATP-binding protein [Mycolicibacterium conceptionense]|uniref:ABC transporter ATP-binding protein n=1 Tax=Mycolicibacterium conceptionense TaxID=451644 RepID=A0A0U1DUT6_9MYCO|nr:ABC transporter ATP-binding protein [Mycolicibacterium conceptionense]
MKMPLIETRALTVTYGERRALQPTNLAVDPGESLAVVGHNGSGKSSLLRAGRFGTVGGRRGHSAR